ncbi:MAG TPA: ATP-binding protein, partial [Acetobacteraceae bacterium]|nr:ATP-binding protein [Acetobacteraceae bacterium]
MDDRPPPPVRDLGFLAGSGEMGAIMRAHDWSASPLGWPETWPQSLRAIVALMINSKYPMFVAWGPELAFLYNDGYRPIFGAKHPAALGLPFRQVWSEIWDDIWPLIERALSGEATWSEDLRLVMHRNGYPEDTWYTFSYSPVRDESGGIAGMFCACTETTGKVLGERRLRILSELGARTQESRDAEDACRRAAEILERNAHEVPFALIYLLSPDGEVAQLAASAGIPAGHAAAPARIALADAGPWPFGEVVATGAAQSVRRISERLGAFPGGPRPDCTDEAVVLPLVAAGQSRPAGFLVTGGSPRRVLDDSYRAFFSLAAGHVATAIANGGAYEAERRRAEALAELDRAKTAFFSNVSHEFRTPLTLLLGPLEETLDRAALDGETRRQIAVAHRNGLRLLRLVNTLLDFSRVEAGRIRAAYRPTDLAARTADLASLFQSACEQAGLGLEVDCPPLPQPVHVDPEMWEKIVLNLLSNAFKFTFEGGIAVSLRARGGMAELVVRDTGTGIPEAELPRIFERFHRIENARGRSHEGTGIGLALVQDLVRLHGGVVEAESRVGEGTAFTVRIPFGTAHLPAGQVREGGDAPTIVTRAEAFVEEALRWLPAGQDAAPDAVGLDATTVSGATEERPRVVLADDNADMRDYIRRLLAGRCEVVSVPDGKAALDAARQARPDLILSDVMMPVLDGFGLVRALRADPALREVPVILLSARAGEEARIEGLDSGADDYLVKPFSARELIARVDSALRLAETRREAQAALRESEARFRSMADHAPVMVWVTDASGHCTFL